MGRPYGPGRHPALGAAGPAQELLRRGLPAKKLDRVDEAGNLYFDGGVFPWKLADDFAEDKRWGYPKWKVLLGRLTGKGRNRNGSMNFQYSY